MNRMSLIIAALFFCLGAPAHAWDEHAGLMSQMMDTNAAKSRSYLKNSVVIPSEDEQKKEIEILAKELDVNAEKIPTEKPGKLSIKDYLQGELSGTATIDEPDMGMDQDLPDSTDPKNDRPWMGGKTGPTSQGYRHMFFPGIEWLSPIRTLQIPFRSIGQSPERILKIHAISEKFMQDKNLYWALRTRLWELHYVQDLHQPFHVMQVPYIRMLPWKDLFHGFVARSTQVVANFHYAYEGLIRESVNEDHLSTLAPCFELPTSSAATPMNEQVVHEIVVLARNSARQIGIPLYQLWDKEMKDPTINLPEGMGALDYYSYLHANPEEENQKAAVAAVEDLLKTTCELMKHVSLLTFSELDQLMSTSIITGK